MVAWKNLTFASGASGTTMAMPFVGSGDGKVATSWQQFKAEERRSEVRMKQY